MTVETHRWISLFGVGAAVVAMATVLTETGLPAQLEWGLMGASTLASAVALGHYQFVRDSDRDADERPFFESRVRYTAFWALFWALFVHTLALAGSGTERGAGALTAVVPAWAVAGSWAAVGLVAVGLGGLNQNVTPARWLKSFRSGRASAEE